MNVRMWTHAATAANVETLKKRGIHFVGPNDGAMACNEFGPGRMSEPEEIVAAIEALLDGAGEAVGRQARAGDLGPDARGDRSGALHLQPFLRQAGPRHRRSAGAARRRGHPGERAGDGARSGRRDGREDRIRRTRCWPPASPPASSTSRSSPPPSPTGRWPSPPTPRSRRSRARRRRRSSSRPTPISWRRSPSRARSGRRWWWASPPRPRTWSPTRSRSGPARAATGSSPTTSRPPPGRSAANATRCT